MNFMNEILRWLALGSRKHPTDDELLRLLDGEVPRWHAGRLRRHIEQCWACRGRYESVQRAILDFVEFRKRMVLPHVSLPSSPRDRFLKKLEELSQANEQPWPTRLGHFLRRTSVPMHNPGFAFLIVVAVFSAIMVVRQRNIPTVSVTEVLDRAQGWDTNGTTALRRGVIYQKLEIRTTNLKFGHSVYRDIEGRRRPRKSPELLKHAVLQRAALSGGVNWEQPLSASDFRKWNEHLSRKMDAVLYNRNGTLTVKTSPADSDVQEESLTVRKDDFHPIERHLLFRDLGEVEIAELSYDVLPWEAVDVAGLFEPESTSPLVTRVPRTPRFSQPPSAALDGAELRARLALNEIGADTGENILVERTSDSVKVAGLVETQARKREIDDAMAGIPLVSCAVTTFEGRAQHDHPAPTKIVREQDVVTQKSPLETYLASRSVPSAQAVKFSRDLINEALQIDRRALALDSLEKRFPEAARSELTPENRGLLQQLVLRHQTALLTAIQKQKQLVKPYHSSRLPEQSAADSEAVNTGNLLRLANQIRQVSADLLGSGGGNGQRSGDEMLAGLAESLDHCEWVAHGLGTTETDLQKKF